MLLLAVLVGLSILYSYVSRPIFVVVLGGVFILGLSIAIGSNAWTQAGPAGTSDPEGAVTTPRRGARRRGRVELLAADATVSLADERRSARHLSSPADTLPTRQAAASPSRPGRLTCPASHS